VNSIPPSGSGLLRRTFNTFFASLDKETRIIPTGRRKTLQYFFNDCIPGLDRPDPDFLCLLFEGCSQEDPAALAVLFSDPNNHDRWRSRARLRFPWQPILPTISISETPNSPEETTHKGPDAPTSSEEDLSNPNHTRCVGGSHGASSCEARYTVSAAVPHSV
jgi:hypothetical protein